MDLTAAEIRTAVLAALAEDIGPGDVTTLATVPEQSRARAIMRAREPLVVAGLPFAELKRRALINPAAKAANNALDFSARIREGRPGM